MTSRSGGEASVRDADHRRDPDRAPQPARRSLAWTPPTYSVDDDGKVVGFRNDRVPNNWSRWGEHDQRGTTNFLTPERVASAAALIREGVVVSCAVPLNERSPVHPSRSPVVHLYRYTGSDMVAGSEFTRRTNGYQGADDYLFMPIQGSTQWDGLAHVGFDDCIYNGYWIGNVEAYAGAKRCSVNELSETLVGRGVLLDLVGYLGGQRLEPGFEISGELLQACADAQQVQIGSGDVVLVRTGHVPWYYELRDKQEFWTRGAPGLGRDSVQWIHDNEIAALAMDNIGIEVEPFPAGETYPLHVTLVRDLGLVLGEMWWLEDLALACRTRTRYEFFLSAPPLRIAGAAGSMINPIALF